MFFIVVRNWFFLILWNEISVSYFLSKMQNDNNWFRKKIEFKKLIMKYYTFSIQREDLSSLFTQHNESVRLCYKNSKTVFLNCAQNLKLLERCLGCMDDTGVVLFLCDRSGIWEQRWTEWELVFLDGEILFLSKAKQHHVYFFEQSTHEKLKDVVKSGKG